MDWWMTTMFVLHLEWYWSHWNIAAHIHTHTHNSRQQWLQVKGATTVCKYVFTCGWLYMWWWRGLCFRTTVMCIELLPCRDVFNTSSGDVEGWGECGPPGTTSEQCNSGGEEEGWHLVGAGPHRDSGVFCEDSRAQQWRSWVSWSIYLSPLPHTEDDWLRSKGGGGLQSLFFYVIWEQHRNIKVQQLIC